MNGWLLDTHTFIWFTEDSPRLSDQVRSLLESRDQRMIVSAASLWEMAIKSATGKLRLPGDPLEMIKSQGMSTLEVTCEHGWESRNLRKIPDHKDPFDRMLAAQAMVECLPILSSDTVFDAYGVERVW